MAISYPLVAKEVAFRSGLVQDGDSGTRALIYSSTSIDSFIDSVEVPAAMLKDTILLAEQQIAERIATSKDSVYRSSLEAVSSPLISGSVVPVAAANGTPFIGVFSAIRDVATKFPYTEQPKRVVMRYLENPGGFWKIQPRYYCFDGNILYHTGGPTPVELVGCAWSRAAADSAYALGGNSVLPAPFEPVLVAMSLALISTEGWFKEESAFYKNLADSMLESLEAGKAQRISLPSMPVSATRPAAAD